MQPSPFVERADLGFAWSVKDSFLQYIRATPDGDIRWSAGAAVTSAGEFFFPLADVSDEDAGIVLTFRGEVRFCAHHGMLRVAVASPRLVLREGSADLLIADGEAVERIASVDLPPHLRDGDVMMWLDCGVTLAESGPGLFGGSYADGEALAPLTVRVPAASLTAARFEGTSS